MNKNEVFLNPLNATGANMCQVPMLTDNYGIERVKDYWVLSIKINPSEVCELKALLFAKFPCCMLRDSVTKSPV